MLKTRKIQRRKKLLKYMKMVRLAKKNNPQTLEFELQNESHPKQINPKDQQHSEVEQKNSGKVWQDSDDQNLVDLNKANITKKLRKNDGKSINQYEYHQKLREFQNSKFSNQFNDWAKEGQGYDQKDYEDILNQDLIETDFKNQQHNIKFCAKSSKKHQSVVTGVDWHNKILFTSGLDKTLKIWSLYEDRPMFQNNFELQKTIYFENMPLSTCVSIDKKVYLGTLRKNYAIYDVQRNNTQLFTSSFLSEHKTYQNFKAKNNLIGIFSNSTLSILNTNNHFIGQVQSNEPLIDVCFSNNQIIGSTKQCLYRWDLRNLKIIEVVRQGLGNTAIDLTPNEDLLTVGSSSGVVYLYQKNNSIGKIYREIPNLVTSITGITSNYDGSLVLAYSKWKKNAIRIIETKNNSVISSWPSMHTRINFPSSVRFSQNSKYIGVGTTAGTVNIYKFGDQEQ